MQSKGSQKEAQKAGLKLVCPQCKVLIVGLQTQHSVRGHLPDTTARALANTDTVAYTRV
jgi:hypothetical protein